MDRHLDADQLSDYAEGILDPAARAAADAHLLGCADCRREAAAAAAYFREMAGLEPVKAPADFLAKVRARLPGESPWRRALAALARPWRVLPLQLALAALIGVTAVSVYVRQGGLERESTPVSAPAPAHERAAERQTTAAPATPSVPAPEEENQVPTKSSQPGGAAVANSPKSAPPEPSARRGKAEAGEWDKAADRAPSEKKLAALPRKDARPLADAGMDAEAVLQSQEAPAAEPNALGRAAETPAPAAPKQRAMAKAEADYDDEEALESGPSHFAASEAPMAGSGSRSESRAASAPAGAAKGKSAPSNLAAAPPAARPESQTAKPSSPPVPVARSGAPSRAMEAESDALPSREPPPDAGKAAFTLRLRAAKDTAAIWKGLKAMGAVLEPDSSVSETVIRRKLSASPSMNADLRKYLARYGTLSVTLGGAKALPERWDLILLLP